MLRTIFFILTVCFGLISVLSEEVLCYSNQSRNPFQFVSYSITCNYILIQDSSSFDCYWRLIVIALVSAVTVSMLVTLSAGAVAVFKVPWFYDQMVKEEYPPALDSE